jgi:Zn-dependent protease/predicted transcriptional regulator
MAESDQQEARARRRGGGSGSGWSLTLGTILGIPVRIHFTFLILLVWFGVVSAGQFGGAFWAALVLVCLFGCVLLHELGHATAARRYGVRTREIVLYPIGGIAQLENIPGGRAELVIALAGPLVNLILAGLLLLAIVLTDPALAEDVARGMEITGPRTLLPWLLFANVMLFVFNLIPAFPMDGGRVLRAALTLRLGSERATQIAARVGQTIAVLFGLAGIFGLPPVLAPSPILVLIALFVFLGATQEAAYERRRTTVEGRTAREAMVTQFETLAPQESLGRASQLLLGTHQQDFPVIDAWGRVAGVLTRSALLEGLAREGSSGAVLDIMVREVPVATPDADLEEILRHLQARPGMPVLVLQEGKLLGMITLENLGEFIEVSRRSPARPGPASS